MKRVPGGQTLLRSSEVRTLKDNEVKMLTRTIVPRLEMRLC